MAELYARTSRSLLEATGDANELPPGTLCVILESCGTAG